MQKIGSLRSFRRWTFVAVYTLGIIALTPYLPNVIRWANARWSGKGVSQFVLKIEISLALFIIILALWLMVHKRKKALTLFLAGVAIFLLSYLLYRILPNPYEYTHLPEYAILSFFLAKALDKKRKDLPGGQGAKKTLRHRFLAKIGNLYWKSGLITGLVGLGDEIYQHFLPRRYFAWYDIFLNILGGIVGLVVFWALKK